MLLLLPLLDAFSKRNHYTTFLKGFGPVIACWLLVVKGPAWLRWLRCKGFGPPGPTDTPQRRSGAALIVLCALAALAVVPCLGWNTLYDRDEGYYVECAREMLQSRDPFVPRFSGEPWLEKPPLSYWFMGASMAILGDAEFAARLPSALFALAAMALTFHLARRMYSAPAAALAAMVLASSLLFSGVMRFALVDMPLVCCVLLSMVGVWRLMTGEGRHGLALFYAGCGLGVLAKGPLGLALPVIALVGIWCWTGQWRMARGMRPVYGLLLVTAIVGLWAVPASWITRGEFFWELVWVRTIAPVFTPLQGHGGGSFLGYLLTLPVYVPILFLGLTPWCVLVVPATRFVVKDAWRADRPGLLCGWTLAQLAVFSLVRTKLPHHVLPLVPPLAIACGAFLADALAVRGRLARVWDRRWVLTYVLGGIVFGAALLLAPVLLGFGGEWIWFIPASLAPVVGGAWVLRDLRRGRDARAVARMAAISLLCLALAWQIGLPRLDRHKAAPQVARFLRERYGPDLDRMRVGWAPGAGFNEVSLVYYLKRPLTKLSGHEEAGRFLNSAEPAVAILAEKKLKDMIRYGLRTGYVVLWRGRVWVPEKTRWLRLLVVRNPRRQ